MPEVANAAPASSAQSATGRRALFIVAALVILIVAAALRFYHLGERSLWYDEAVTALASRGTASYMLERTREFSAPIVHPAILFLEERAGRSAAAVRAPSALASLLAVLLVLAMVRVKLNAKAALFAAALLALSASQVRYAQEVREYSLSVLYAIVLMYCLLEWEANGSRNRFPAMLCTALLIAPLVQYGLVFLALAILGTMALRAIGARDSRFTLSHAIMGTVFLGVGSLATFFLTLRYQVHAGTVWYLAQNYYDPARMSLLHFLALNGKEMMSFFFPGQIATVLFALCALVFCIALVRSRRLDPLTLVTVLAFLLTIAAAVMRHYPFGGVRQCLFLSAPLALFAGLAFAHVIDYLKGRAQMAATAAMLLLILYSGYRGLFKQWPYGEYEDTRSILAELARSSAPGDQVWVNHDAVPAFDFYQPQRDPRFIYGVYRVNMNDYLSDLSGSIKGPTHRLWLVFSHVQQERDRNEEQLIVNSLAPGWTVHQALAPTNTLLFVADRKANP
jgi:hypothetical protein